MNTWPTQPVPQSDNVLFNKLNASGLPCTDGAVSQTNAYVPYASATAPDGKPYKIGCIYDPYDTTQYVVFPFEMMDWPASSYSPENHTFITCGVTDRAAAKEQIPAASQVVGAFGGIGAGPSRRRGHLDRQHRQLLGVRRDDAASWPGTSTGRSVLQRLDEHGRGDHVHRLARRRERPERPRLPRRRWTRRPERSSGSRR